MPPYRTSNLTPSAEVAQSPADRLAAILADPNGEPITLTREQLAYLMHSAGRWAADALSYDAGYQAGYRARCAEENAKHPAAPVFKLGRWYDQAAYRQHCDEQAAKPRDNDYTGGPVEVWN